MEGKNKSTNHKTQIRILILSVSLGYFISISVFNKKSLSQTHELPKKSKQEDSSIYFSKEGCK